MEIPKNGFIFIQLTDNVLDDEDWTVVKADLDDGKVRGIEYIRKGAYGIDYLIGRTIEQLEKAANDDPTGHHPEEYLNIYVPLPYKGDL